MWMPESFWASRLGAILEARAAAGAAARADFNRRRRVNREADMTDIIDGFMVAREAFTQNERKERFRTANRPGWKASGKPKCRE
jgi:hypothetical protein